MNITLQQDSTVSAHVLQFRNQVLSLHHLIFYMILIADNEIF